MSRLESARACAWACGRGDGREGGAEGELQGDEATLLGAEEYTCEGEGGARPAGSAAAAVSAAAMATADTTACTFGGRMGSRALLGRTIFTAACAAANRVSIGGVLLPLW